MTQAQPDPGTPRAGAAHETPTAAGAADAGAMVDTPAERRATNYTSAVYGSVLAATVVLYWSLGLGLLVLQVATHI